ncbi:Ca-activated chloride channel family protein [Singulisphaera sp. GP187]|uniref:VIT domain-containing protein n=1 Tax=Singulisphaera sp. GP187 TaxID=1882752 RepID=UPI000926AC8E|nr:VIT domain-containing protein [Singulisphaera sp. GP187]SIO67234.1 Ca-activated chloride channel family protein [Singulisphaera sp. GP187]
MKPRVGRYLIVFALALTAPPYRAWSQGLLIDRRPNHPVARSYEIREVTVDAKVRDQVAEVQVAQTFHNPGSTVLESEYYFPLPEEGAIQNFVLMVDGKELPGRLLPKDEARRIYEEIVRSKRDPALLEYMGRGLFRTSVFPIPPGADRKVTMRYTQLCKRDRDLVEFAYPFGTQKFTAKPIQRLSLVLQIQSRDAIKSIYSPTSDTTIRRDGDHDARILLEQRDIVPNNDFRLVYSLAEGALGATVMSYRPSGSDDGYFLMLTSPQVKAADVKPQPKTVIFVLDRSGSMAGKKIEQARKALQFVLNNLRDDDLFNIVVYDDRVETFQPELQRYTSRTRAEADRFVDNIREGGATNIDAALKSALDMIHDDSRPSYVLFLTDGLPTAGETGEMAIAEGARKANREHARIFAFGVGYDVNSRLLDRLSGGNSGTSEYVKPDDDIESHVSRFYAKMTSPVLTDIRVELADTDVNRTYPRDLPDLFEGGQLVWVGRYRQSGRTTVRLTGRAGGERRSFEFPAELASTDRGMAYDFVERVWAMRRVGHIIDEIDLRGQNKELIDELVSLSTKYGIMTPYTSFLADERVTLHAGMANTLRAGESLRELEVTDGASGVNQRGAKRFYQDAARPSAPGYSFSINPSAPAASSRTPAAESSPLAGRSERLGGMGGFGAGSLSVRRDQAQLALNPNGNQPGLSDLQAKDADGKPSVRQVGAKTFYFKNGHWVDSTVKPEEAAKATVIEQFSDAFFRLAETQKSELNQYLTFDEPVTVNLDGQVYRFEIAKP